MFKHHWTNVSNHAPDNPEEVGRWDVIEEDDGTFSVFSRGSGLYVRTGIETLKQAGDLAEKFCVAFDRIFTDLHPWEPQCAPT